MNVNNAANNKLKFIGITFIIGVMMVFIDGLRIMEVKTSKSIALNTERLELINNNLRYINQNEYPIVVGGLKSQKETSEKAIVELSKDAAGYSKIYWFVYLLNAFILLALFAKLTIGSEENKSA